MRPLNRLEVGGFFLPIRGYETGNSPLKLRLLYVFSPNKGL